MISNNYNVFLSVLFLFILVPFMPSYAELDEACRDSFVLLHKTTTGKPVCVKSTSVDKLVQRGWAIIPETSQLSSLSKSIVNANNQFGLDMYLELTKNNDDNLFFSPWSIYNSAALLYEGASGTTSNELIKAFGYLDNLQQQRDKIKTINDNLDRKGTAYNFTIANSIWLDYGFTPLQEYVDIAEVYYDSTAQTIDFKTENDINKIDDWISKKTNGKITGIFDKRPIDENARMIGINTVYLTASWDSVFHESDTYVGNFWINNTESVPATMMYQESPNHNMSFMFATTELAHIMKMHTVNHEMSMVVFLPWEKDGLDSLEKSFSIQMLDDLNFIYARNVQLTLPKFMFETQYDLVPILKTMGVNTSFNPLVADFAKISQKNTLYVGDMLHKTYIDVNEKGIEAAAGTATQIVNESGGYEFTADHPFIFMILDNDSENILFVGRYGVPDELNQT